MTTIDELAEKAGLKYEIDYENLIFECDGKKFIYIKDFEEYLKNQCKEKCKCGNVAVKKIANFALCRECLNKIKEALNDN